MDVERDGRNSACSQRSIGLFVGLPPFPFPRAIRVYPRIPLGFSNAPNCICYQGETPVHPTCGSRPPAWRAERLPENSRCKALVAEVRGRSQDPLKCCYNLVRRGSARPITERRAHPGLLADPPRETGAAREAAVKPSGIEKKIPFHNALHTLATLSPAHGFDLYTVSVPILTGGAK